ncbi:MFS transporter [Pseudomonas aeruginosa]|uniref:MFS transporter n=1 Tax=Pseudomonas aeruginosa TaxID=287 RepID=UPI0009ADC043|nr:MFS transporter [Pseudomonas aeruginosa]KSQ21815.2 MFS transporter [Pseudomonas aeruginosa]RPV61351.1 MFS transporter [Pseudomonas aeruginosa]
MSKSLATRPEIEPPEAVQTSDRWKRAALRFILLMGVLSFFADFTYEGARSSIGPYLATLGATATIVGVVTGLGELLGYGLRLISGRLADSTGQFWPISIVGYFLQMSAVPALALTHDWQSAAALIVLERVGKAVRNPPRDVMLAQAAKQVGGYGWTFGIHEALDQFGAMLGPLLVAAVLAHQGDYRSAFALLVVPAALNITLVLLTRWLYPRPQDMESEPNTLEQTNGFSRTYWLYFFAAMLVAAGFADYPLMAYHFSRTHSVPTQWIAIFYAVAMGVSGCGSLLFGRLFDRYGFRVLVGLTLVSSIFAPLALLGGFWSALWGAAIWGLGMGVHESIIPAAVAPMVPSTRRASAFGQFTAGYGIAWFAGSSLIGVLYDHSVMATVAFCVLSQLAAVPILWYVGQRIGAARQHAAAR